VNKVKYSGHIIRSDLNDNYDWLMIMCSIRTSKYAGSQISYQVHKLS